MWHKRDEQNHWNVETIGGMKVEIASPRTDGYYVRFYCPLLSREVRFVLWRV